MKTQESQRCILRMAHDHSPDDVDGSVAMVKTELRKTIQSRREAKGLGSVELHDQEEKKTIEVLDYLPPPGDYVFIWVCLCTKICGDDGHWPYRLNFGSIWMRNWYAGTTREEGLLASRQVESETLKILQTLSADEREKINSRRERNRLSAQKCRKRRREQVVYLSQEAKTIEDANGLLESEIEYLQMEKQQLSHMLREHCCNMTRGTSHSQRNGVS